MVLELGRGPRRFGELGRRIEGISQKMLTRTLRGLERDGLVTREVHPVIPPRVDYSLTDLGAELREVVERMEAWASKHLGRVMQARSAFDERYG